MLGCLLLNLQSYMTRETNSCCAKTQFSPKGSSLLLNFLNFFTVRRFQSDFSFVVFVNK